MLVLNKMFIIYLLSLSSTCADCTESHFCLVKRATDAECISEAQAVGFGGCGTTGFYELNGEEVAFSSEVCTITEKSEQEDAPEQTPSSSERLSDGAIAGIVSGSVVFVVIVSFVSYRVFRTTSTPNEPPVGRYRRFV